MHIVRCTRASLITVDAGKKVRGKEKRGEER